MKHVTNEQIKALHAAHSRNKGTANYYHFNMQAEAKVGNRWVMVGYGIPASESTAELKVTARGTWLMSSDGKRYMLTPQVKEFLESTVKED